MIDLDRLREARDGEYWDVEVLYALGDAALDAPVVWWCAFQEARDPIGCWNLKPEYRALENHDDCRWVALVPVKGGQE